MQSKNYNKSMKNKKNKSKVKIKINKNNIPLFIFCLIIFLTGLGIFMYPFVSNMINRHNASEAITDFDKQIADMDKDDIDVIKQAAKEYNQQLENAVLTGDEEKQSYKDISGVDKVIGYIVIPKIDVNLPIYSGTSPEVLKKGAGHMQNSSYPLGGSGTQCVLTGHRGLPSAVLFTDLDKVEPGDEFYLHVLDEVLAYQVDKIKVVEPTEGTDLGIVEGKDYCTLVTCTPYAINSHRLLVRGTRVEYSEAHQNDEGKTQLQSGSFTKRVVDVWPWLLIASVVILGAEAIIFIMIIRKGRKEKE